MDVRNIHPLQSAHVVSTHVVSTLHALLIADLRACASSLLWEMGELHVCPTCTACLQAGVLAPAPLGLITAFSREAPPPQAEAGRASAGSGKVYVTQRIREHGAALWALLGLGAPAPSAMTCSAVQCRGPQPAAACGCLQEATLHSTRATW